MNNSAEQAKSTERSRFRRTSENVGEVVFAIGVIGGAIGLIGGAAFGAGHLVAGDSKMDILGDSPRDRPSADRLAEARSDFASMYDLSSDAGKIALLYAGGSVVRVDSKTDGNGFLCLVGRVNRQEYYRFGQGCLAGTGYDTTPSGIRISGFSSGGGDISAIATVNVDEATGDVLVYPASGQGATLQFHRQESDGLMVAADAKTADTLRVNGCDPARNPLAVQQ